MSIILPKLYPKIVNGNLVTNYRTIQFCRTDETIKVRGGSSHPIAIHKYLTLNKCEGFKAITEHDIDEIVLKEQIMIIIKELYTCTNMQY